jgi:hypothetical protein
MSIKTRRFYYPVLYGKWYNMMQRCYNPNFKGYHLYGGRGIQVCERWHIFEHFLSDMGEPPPGMSLERERNNEDYSPDNCKWATRLEQSRNTRRNVYLTLRGETHCLSEWAELTGMPRPLLAYRKRKGWSDEEILTTPE